MQTIQILGIEDIKTAVREVLAEQKPKTDREPERYVHGLKGLTEFGIGQTTGWKLVKSGKLPHYRSGKKIFFKKSEIEAVLANRF